MSNICEVMKILPIKRWLPFNIAKILQVRHFVVGRPKKFKLLSDISFDNGFQKIVLSSLVLFSCACYYFDLDNVQWNKVVTLTARNFSSSWLLYLHFSNMLNPWPTKDSFSRPWLNLCPNSWFIKNSKCQQLLFWRKSLQKPSNFLFF